MIYSTTHCSKYITTKIYINSEKKKSLFIGGGPATRPLGISTISPDKSGVKTTSLNNALTIAKRHKPSNLIFSPISVRAWTNPAVSLEDTCPPSLRSIFNPSVQSAHRDWSGAIWSARDPSCALNSENESGDGTEAEAGGRSFWSRNTFGGGAQIPVAISLIKEMSILSGRSSSPLRTGNLTALST